MVKKTLDESIRTAETRRDWAIKKSKALAKRRLELEGGAPRASGVLLADSIKQYYDDHPNSRQSTLDLYKRTTDKLLRWASRAGVQRADDLTAERLVAFRASLIREKKSVPVAGGKKGEMRATDETRAPRTVNIDLRAARAVLGYLRELGHLSKVTTDGLRDGLKRLEEPREENVFLRPVEAQKLMDAVLRHDSAKYRATRAEHAGSRPEGSTPRHQPIAPFVVFVLLSGMRLDEALTLQWSQVDLDALDNEGSKVGEIRLTTATKTKKRRTVGLEVSPALRRMLAALRLRGAGKGSVFGVTRGAARAAERRLRREYGAPPAFGWQVLRSTTGTFLVNSQIYGAGAVFLAARQLGHSVAVAERCYLGVLRGISRDARTLDAAMGIEKQMDRVIAAIGEAPARKRKIG